MSLALPFQTAKQLAAAVRKKKIGCLELLDLYLKRVEAYNPELNAIIATDIEGARKRAKAADKAVKAGKKLGPLHGVPMTIKESYDVAGLPTTWGHPAFKDTIVKTNALVTQRMIDAGVTLFGKTNVPLNLADWQSYNEVYGSTNNPWDLSRTPGGSSGGSGAALAAGLTGIEAGSDIGGSIRNPASYNGVWGHKPTWGVVSPRGHALNGRVAQADISVCGPLARGAEDLEIAMDVMAGPDAIDAPRLDAHPAAVEEKEAARLQGRGAALRPQRRGRPFGAGRDPEARRLPRQEEGEGERQGKARHRYRGAGRRLCPHAAGDDIGPHERCRVPGGAARRRPPCPTTT